MSTKTKEPTTKAAKFSALPAADWATMDSKINRKARNALVHQFHAKIFAGWEGYQKGFITDCLMAQSQDQLRSWCYAKTDDSYGLNPTQVKFQDVLDLRAAAIAAMKAAPKEKAEKTAKTAPKEKAEKSKPKPSSTKKLLAGVKKNK